jgi:hypothetical protein
MREIYRYADRVVVWLGPPSENSALALSTLEHLGKQIESSRDYFVIPSPNRTEPEWYKREIELPFDEGVGQGILDILERPWFERQWIVQEIQLGSSTSIIQCGVYQISWYLFRRAIKRLEMGRMPDSLLLKVNESADICDNVRGDSLPALLHCLNHLKCSNPLDKVYGILGIAPPLIASKIHPKYEFPVTEVYKNTVLGHLSVVRRLELLDQCDIRTRLTEGPYGYLIGPFQVQRCTWLN